MINFFRQIRHFLNIVPAQIHFSALGKYRNSCIQQVELFFNILLRRKRQCAVDIVKGLTKLVSLACFCCGKLKIFSSLVC